MKKIIDGRTYNTETAKCIGSWDNGIYGHDFRACSEDLYRNSKGSWFLYGEGGPMSEYARQNGNETTGGENIIPMTEDEARAWAEEHMNAEDFEAVFGVLEEADPGDLINRSRVNVVLDTKLYEALKAYSAKVGMPVSRLLDRAISETYKL